MKDIQTTSQRFERIIYSLKSFGQIFIELGRGFLRREPVLFRAMIGSVIIGFAITFQFDVWIFKKINLWQYYPPDGWWFKFYALSMMWSPIFLYGIAMKNKKMEFAKNLKEVFDLVGLKNAIGSYPKFLNLIPLTGGTMKLTLTNGSFPKAEWDKRKQKLEANMRIFVDEIDEVPEKGLIEMTFSYEPMPTKVSLEDIYSYRDYKFFMGRDRIKSYVGDFAENPHFLIAGESGGGKSAFLRQLFTTIKVNQPESQFLLMDLKAGLEFEHLRKIPGVTVICEIQDVASALQNIVASIHLRIQNLKSKNYNDIKQFFKSLEYQRMTVEEKRSHTLGHRTFVVVDECAEIFLFGLGHKPEYTREIRACMSKITRLGRACGVHVVLATQRPDKNAVDPQVKSNLTSTVCYRIHDIGGSLAVLGTGRAMDLPKIAGRAVLAQGSQEVEIQTPFLDFAESQKLLAETFKISLDLEPTSINSGKSNKEAIKHEKVMEPYIP